MSSLPHSALPPANPMRRDFLKLAGAATLSAPAFLRGAGPEGEARKIVESAGERIARHRKGRASLTLLGPDGKPLPEGTTVRISQQRHRFLFGCNIFKLDRCRTPEDNATYAERFQALLNFATLPFYWWMYEPVRGLPGDDWADYVARWCREHGILAKGHPLAWNFVDPKWLRDVSQENVLPLQIERISRCVARFKGLIDTWDVVNEATHYDRPEPKRDAPKLTEAIRQAGVGEYVRRAFQAARDANPSSTLLINDYRVDPDYERKVLGELLDQANRPLYDVIGLQSHMHGNYWGAGKIWDVCERFAKYGKPLHFTEATVVSGPKMPGGWKTTAEGEERQAALVAEFYTVLFSHPAVEAITWWDFSDQGAWQHAPAGLLREDMSPKAVYERLMDLVKNRWWTRAVAKVQEGAVSLDGFFGSYEVTASAGSQHLTGRFSHEKGIGTAEIRLA